MTDGSGTLDLAIDRIVLDGLDLPADAVATFGGLIEAELRRILDGGMSATSGGPAELRPLILSTPRDVMALARDIAQRIADRGATSGAWNG